MGFFPPESSDIGRIYVVHSHYIPAVNSLAHFEAISALLYINIITIRAARLSRWSRSKYGPCKSFTRRRQEFYLLPTFPSSNWPHMGMNTKNIVQAGLQVNDCHFFCLYIDFPKNARASPKRSTRSMTFDQTG